MTTGSLLIPRTETSVSRLASEDAGDMKVTGFSIKASSAPAVTKELIGEAFRMIGSGADEDEVYEALRPSIKELFSGEKSADYAASFGRIKKQLHEYDKVVPNPAKAARYSNRYLGTNYNKGESIKWVFIDDVPGRPRVLQCNRLR